MLICDNKVSYKQNFIVLIENQHKKIFSNKKKTQLFSSCCRNLFRGIIKKNKELKSENK